MLKLTCFILVGSLCGALVGCDESGDPDGAGGDGTGSTSTGAGTPCGDDTCDTTEYCGFAPGTCSGEKSCQSMPAECSQLACGCDGQNYAEDCGALDASGGILSVGEPCEPRAGQFTCIYEYEVPIYCDLGTDYCHIVPTGGAYELSCEALPTACTPQPGDCACLLDECSTNYCGVDPQTNAATVLCPL